MKKKRLFALGTLVMCIFLAACSESAEEESLKKNLEMQEETQEELKEETQEELQETSDTVILPDESTESSQGVDVVLTQEELNRFTEYFNIRENRLQLSIDEVSADDYISPVECVSGYSNNDTYTIRLREINEFETGEMFYYAIEMEAVLHKQGDGYETTARKYVMDENRIDGIDEPIILSDGSTASLVAYAPIGNYCDATFYVIDDTRPIVRIPAKTICYDLAQENFVSVEGISVGDFDSDGYLELIIIEKFKTDEGMEYVNPMVYQGDELDMFTMDENKSVEASLLDVITTEEIEKLLSN